MNYGAEYRNKLTTADKVAAIIESGDNVDYGNFNGKPIEFDQALARRYEELKNVQIWTVCNVLPIPETAKQQGSFIYNDWHFSALSRILQSYDRAYYSPILYHAAPSYYDPLLQDQRSLAVLQVAPMDKHGYFNFGPQSSIARAVCQSSRRVCVEVNPHQPVCLGGAEEAIHISEVDYIIEQQEEYPLYCIPAVPPTEEDSKIASHIMPHLHDGCVVQFGIGGVPNAIGKSIAESDLKNLGAHTEMMVDSYIDLIEKGIVNGRRKELDRGRLAYTFALGNSPEFYEYINGNARLASYSVDYTNDPRIISRLSNYMSINAALEIDIYSQISSESYGSSQISGNGGLWDFVLGAQWSKGGKSFICTTSTYTDKEGVLHSRIVPKFAPYTITTIPRQMVDYIVTEYGCYQLKAQATWQRAEYLIELAHPQFRDGLIEEAKNLKIWTRTNRLGY